MSDAIAVLGGGSWGTTLGNLLAKKGHAVRLWAYEDDVVRSINTAHENTMYFAGVPLHANLVATGSIEEAVAGASVVVSVSPAQHVRRVVRQAAAALRDDTLVISASKGIEKGTLSTMAEVLEDVLPPGGSHVCLSGPSFAAEVARELPTAVTVASRRADAARRAQLLFQTPYFRVYTSEDVVGVELGGALKNVIAIAAGMAVGLGLGHNATAALITRGLAEIARLGRALGAKPLTFSGLAGMGDLILTCTGELSRNRRVGMELGRGRELPEILAGMKTVAEGVDTAVAARELARRENIEMPIIETVHAVLFEGFPVRSVLESLMLREPKPEFWS